MYALRSYTSIVCLLQHCIVTYIIRECHLCGQYWDLYRGVPCISQVTAPHLKIVYPWRSFTGASSSHRDYLARNQGLYSLSGKTSYRKISWSLEAARFGFKLFQSLWNLTGTSAALLPRCLSNFRAIRPLQHPISRLRDFTRFGGKTSYRLVNRGPGKSHQHCPPGGIPHWYYYW